MSTATDSRIGRWAEMIAAAVPELAAIRGTVENELLAMATLHALHAESLLPREAVFIGGTCLRLCHGSPRFSDDLDFHLPPAVAFRGLDAELLRQTLEPHIGAAVAVSLPLSEQTSRLARISAVLPERNRSQRRPRTRIDMARKAQLDARDTIVSLHMAGGNVPGLGDLADPLSIPASSKEEILVDKHLALVGRAKRIKQRDVFDILWLRHQGVEFQADLLAAKLPADQHESFPTALRQRATAGSAGIAGGEYAAEMRRFLPQGSTWLFDDNQQAMAGAFATLVTDNARLVERALRRTSVASRQREDRSRG